MEIRSFLPCWLSTCCLLATGAFAQTPCEEAKLLASDPDDDDRFGQAVAIHGDVALAGAFKHDDQGLNSGSTYVFRYDGTNWAEEAELLASDGASQDRFGWSVAVCGNVAVVGAREDDDAGSNSGSAYVFRFDGTAWVEEAKLTASDAAGGDEFGVAVAVDGDTALVGANFDDHSAVDAGAAYVFRFDGTNWSQEAKLTALDAEASDDFGLSVGLDGDLAIVGAQLESQGGSNAGAAYVFRRTGTTWAQEQKLLSSDLLGNDRFGFSVAASGDAVLVGAMNDDAPSSSSGSAYVFRFDGTTWSQEQQLVAGDASFADFFGWSVSLDGDVAAVGAQLEDGTASDSGSAYVYRRDAGSGVWGSEAKITGSDIAATDFFGFSVSIHGDRVLVGAWGGDVGGGEAGAAYVFTGVLHDCEGVVTYCTGKTNALGCVPFMSSSGVPSATDTSPFSLVANDLVPAELGLILYSFKKANLNFHGGKLCVKAPATRWFPNKSAKAVGPPPCTGRISRNFNSRIQSGVDPALTPGASVFAQVRQRDPGDPAGFGDALTNAVRFVVSP